VTHIAEADLELYVLDALAPGARNRLEEHATGCDRCAGALAAEARLELRLEALWPEVQRARQPLAAVVPLRPRARPAPARRPGLGGLAAAAAALLLIGWWSDRTGPETPGAGSALAAPAVCRLAAPDAVDGPLCMTAPISPEALASWASCVAPRASSALCGRATMPAVQ
jgi:anti-sigma factor RsiW